MRVFVPTTDIEKVIDLMYAWERELGGYHAYSCTPSFSSIHRSMGYLVTDEQLPSTLEQVYIKESTKR